MKVIIFCFQGLIAWLGATGYCYANVDSICPATIRLSTATIVPEDIPSGYQPLISKTIVRLSGASVLNGSPEKIGILIPSTYSSSGNYAKWNFDKEANYEISVSCDYANGLVRLVKHVKAPVSSCMMTSRKIKPEKILDIKFSCK